MPHPTIATPDRCTSASVIGTNGSVRDVTVAGGYPLLVPAAKNAVNLWAYKPTLVNGQLVEVITTVDVPFP